jgi:hypothetical protein
MFLLALIVCCVTARFDVGTDSSFGTFLLASLGSSFGNLLPALGVGSIFRIGSSFGNFVSSLALSAANQFVWQKAVCTAK